MKANPDPAEYGGSVIMSGFRELDDSEQSAIQKIISHHEGRLKELCGNEIQIKLTMKKVHAKEKSEKYEVHARLTYSKGHKEAEVIDRSLPIAVDSVLEKIQNEVQ